MTLTSTELTDDETLSRRLGDWRRRLLDLSYSNPLIKFSTGRSTAGVEIRSPSPQELLRKLHSSEPHFFYYPPEEGGEEKEDGDEPGAVEAEERDRSDLIQTTLTNRQELVRILDSLARRSRNDYNDKGLRVLYLGVGFLNWRDQRKEEDLTSPLVLVPVELRRNRVGEPYCLHLLADEDIVINPTLKAKIESDCALTLPEEWDWEDKPLSEELDDVRRAVQGTGWTVTERTVLSIFHFQKMVMYRDLLENEELITDHPLIRSIALSRRHNSNHAALRELPDAAQLDRDHDIGSCYSVLDADSSQRGCIEASKRGTSFVMQGPPGTGKSQTITNIIAEALGEGKRVLFVSEKIAALDVVYKRLEAAGLGALCLNLHGDQATRASVVSELASTLRQLPERPGREMPDTDLEELNRARDRLNATAQKLHEPNPKLHGYSFHRAFGELAAAQTAPVVEGAPAPTFDSPEDDRRNYNEILRLFRSAATVWDLALDRDHPWRGFAKPGLGSAEMRGLRQQTSELVTATEALSQAAHEAATVLGHAEPPTFTEVRRWLTLGKLLVDRPDLQEAALNQRDAEAFREAISAAEAAHAGLADEIAAHERTYRTRMVSGFPEGIGRKIGGNLDRLETMVGRNAAWEEILTDVIPRITDLCRNAATDLHELERDTHILQENLGQPKDHCSLKAATDLAELARLAHAIEDRPDPSWLNRFTLEQVGEVLEELGPKIERCQEVTEQLRSRYREEIFEIDPGPLLALCEPLAERPLASLRRPLRELKRHLRMLSKAERTPDDPIGDLKMLEELWELHQQVSQADAKRCCLGAWDNGLATDVAAARRAHARAEEILRLSSPRGDREVLAKAVGVDRSPNPDVLDAADRVLDNCRRLKAGLEAIEEISSRRTHRDLAGLGVSDLADLIAELAPVTAALESQLEEITNGMTSTEPGLAEICEAAFRIDRISRSNATIEANAERWRALFGGRYRGEDTDWDELRKAAAWLERLYRLYPEGLGVALRERLLTLSEPGWPDFGRLESTVASCQRSVAILARQFLPEQDAALKQMGDDGEIDALAAHCRRMLDEIDALPRWAELEQTSSRIREAGWGDYLDALITNGVAAEQVEASVVHAYWEARLAEAFADSPELKQFKGRSHESLIDEFRELDARSIESAADRILARYRSRRELMSDELAQSEVVLKREAGKKRQRWSVKRLLHEVGDLALTLKPCLMMSPLTVSMFLSADHQFDLVIFDEASQVPPADSINCIYRGRQLIVSGDSRQLPPTNFFGAQEVDEAELSDESSEEKFQEVMESVLDLCETVLPTQRLRWHYRSRHEHLIAFSNRHFYDNSLITFPSPDLESEERGVHFIHVPDGIYDRGRSQTNRIEAARVAERVFEHLVRRPDRTLGVVTFNARQRDAIEDALELKRRERPDMEHLFSDDRLEGLFVKNLESVQGDERDVIIFSIGYGLDEHGRFTMNFGALNSEGGERRLNVAITRAREQVDVVSSVLPSQFTLGAGARPGALRLRDYLQFAAEGPTALAKEFEAQGGDFDSPFEKAVAEAIRELGYEIIPQVGAGGFRIDLGVIDPDNTGRFVLGIECDGATYHSTPTARDRDRLRQRILEGLGWNIHRIWSRDWVRNRPTEIERLRKAIESRRSMDAAAV